MPTYWDIPVSELRPGQALSHHQWWALPGSSHSVGHPQGSGYRDGDQVQEVSKGHSEISAPRGGEKQDSREPAGLPWSPQGAQVLGCLKERQVGLARQKAQDLGMCRQFPESWPEGASSIWGSIWRHELGTGASSGSHGPAVTHTGTCVGEQQGTH